MSEDQSEGCVVRYWNDRARGFSEATRIVLDSGNSQILRTIGRFFNLNRKSCIADMGTGAGLVAIMMANMGHHVVGVDSSENMLEKARENADMFGVAVDFVRGDIEEPPLKKGTFDLILAKDCVWNLAHPEKAYYAWRDLLRPGGAIVVIDGNYYLDLYDDEYRRRKEYFELNHMGEQAGIHAQTNVDNVDFQIIRDVAKNLPLSKQRRPTWDVSILAGMGMTEISIHTLDAEPYSVLTNNGLTVLPMTFILCAKATTSQDVGIHDSKLYPVVRENELARMIDSRLIGLYSEAIGVVKALSDEGRLKIVTLLLAGRSSVQDMANAMECSQSLVSHNLRILKDAGIVVSQRAGKESLYRLVDREWTISLIELCLSIKERV